MGSFHFYCFFFFVFPLPCLLCWLCSLCCCQAETSVQVRQSMNQTCPCVFVLIWTRVQGGVEEGGGLVFVWLCGMCVLECGVMTTACMMSFCFRSSLSSLSSSSSLSPCICSSPSPRWSPLPSCVNVSCSTCRFCTHKLDWHCHSTLCVWRW